MKSRIVTTGGHAVNGAASVDHFSGRSVVPGIVIAEALVSSEPISGWGGIDPVRGTVIETRHELQDVCFTDKVLIFPSAKGSSGWSGFFQSTRLLGTSPAALVFNTLSTKAVLGAVVTRVPTVAELDCDPVAAIRSGDTVEVNGDLGTLRVVERAS